MVVKGGNFRFRPRNIQRVLMDQFAEVAQMASRRMEQDAKMYLNERIGNGIKWESKSTGTLEQGITGYVTVTDEAVYAGVTATALELGQWENSRGEPDEAERATMNPPFDYAAAVEGGTGEFGPRGAPITPRGSDRNLRFWAGEYEEYDSGWYRKIYAVPQVSGQPPKNFLRDAMITVTPELRDLISKVGYNLTVEQVVRWN